MSIAEQVIAEVVREHTPMHDNGPFGDDPWTGCAGKDCADWPGGDDEAFDAHVAAHVVAALTNAGKTIVELPEAMACSYSASYWDGETVWATPGSGKVRIQLEDHRLTAADAQGLAAALLAAARVAEGGERGE
ncbi:hypothetical protein MWT96_20405 [Prescottella equi]|uniref:hypothetical protein n=1 Tax=Rhodococcus hoagii TaxID=43767 RepID=UPI001F991D12|nr:hypothetical protein [Prescottella equi]UPH36717.1 hypothetical protein GS533_001295 [Prescottella equi]UPH40832.1 hypothetical protein MWT96_20405 [Prescottella equi]